ncbi:MAG TPA: hypothetical protein VFT29_17555 [Gemmatimonadaceae bacterium]|nr:hypothetical protein [Gemmatimonadaceae bacterium]
MLVRDAVKGHGMNETAISTKALEDIDDKVTQAMSDYIKRINLPVRLVEVTVGRANPPDAIKHQRVETATQEQRINTERQRKLAEDERAKAELSRAAADNAYRNAMQLSPEQFLRRESIKMQRDVCIAAGTHCSFVPSSAVPTFDLRPR